MARKIEFDYDQALDEATRLFWQKGYANTSLRELLKVMKIGEGSFYNTVKSKKHLYLECLKHYSDTVTPKRLEALFSPASATEGIRSFFKYVLDDLDDPKTPRICLMVGSLSDDVLIEQELKQYVVDRIIIYQNSLSERLQRAKESGELPEQLDVEVTAQIILTYLQGVAWRINVVVTRSEVERQIELLLSGLGL